MPVVPDVSTGACGSSSWSDGFFANEAWRTIQRARYTPTRADTLAAGICARLGLSAGARLLDVPCGNGPLSVALARRGVLVTGMDLDEGWVREARDAAAAAGVQIDASVGDMRHLPWKGHFDAVLSWWSSFGYFDAEGNAEHAIAMRSVLRPGGALLLDMATLETVCGRSMEPSWAEVGGVRVLEARTLDAVEGRLRTTWTFEQGERTETLHSDLWLPSCAELVNLLRRVGFSSFEASADLDGHPFGPGTRLVLLARVSVR